VRNQRFKNLALPTVLAMITPWITAHTAIAADSIVVELTKATQHLVGIVREGDEETGVTGSPIMVSTNCNYQRQWWYERCGLNEALVPFTTSGPGSAVWNYVALFRILPKETEMDAEIRREYHRNPKQVSLVTFAFISEPFGLVDWKTAHVEGSHVIVQTRHWTDRDAHSDPSMTGTIQIDLDGGLKLTNLP
jgi:hypothetical protein